MFTKKRNGRDVYLSSMDVRFERSFLAKPSNLRTMWWKLNNFVEKLLHPYSTLEERMYRFHSRHQRWTLLRLEGIAVRREAAIKKSTSAVVTNNSAAAAVSTRPGSRKTRTLGDI